MKLAVKLFARARDLVGANQVELELPDQSTVRELRTALTDSYPALALLASSLLIAIGTEYAADQVKLSSESDVACFPPVSGG